MKIKDNVVDDILKGLADYKPQAEPDWDSFYTTYQKDISEKPADAGHTTGGKAALTSGLRISIVAIIALTGIIAAYFLFFNSSDADSPKVKQTIQSPVQTDATPSNQNTTIIPDDNSGHQADQMLKSSGLPGNEILENTGSGMDIGSSSKASSVTMPFINEPPFDKGLESPAGENEPGIQFSDTLPDHPVLIKKTVIITDTVKVSRPHKK